MSVKVAVFSLITPCQIQAFGIFRICHKDLTYRIDRRDLPFIFDKFYRVNQGDLYDTPGYGLGLFYVKKIVDLFGWSIAAKSKKGEGTKFIITFSNNEKR
ncbi:MAG: ATP-binding protein [Muribaculaceae bacterium]|nr:ATP-binding protein [Muribaculaceae bacterium]